jgi:FkbM family methyltransferase
MFEAALTKVIDQLRPEIAAWPRRLPGQLLIGDKILRYADLHSFYHQSIQIFQHGLYDFSCDRPDPVILDCGAHIGLASIYFKLRYPNARIQAFEADPVIAELATRNLGALGFGDVTVDPRAVWTGDGGVSFDTSGDDAGHVASKGQKVPSVRLADVLAAQPIDLLKLDVEGAEFQIVDDCRPALRHVNKMILEVHRLGPDSPSFAKLLGALEDAGFHIGFHDLHQAKWIPSAAKPPFAALATDRLIISVYAWR